VQRKQTRLAVQKTYKLYIGGKFVRGENGRVLPARGKGGALLANFCRASKKDFRDAVVAARAAFPNWSTRSFRKCLARPGRGKSLLDSRHGRDENGLAPDRAVGLH